MASGNYRRTPIHWRVHVNPVEGNNSLCFQSIQTTVKTTSERI